MGLPALFTRVEAHEENWEASTTEPQTYETTIEYQRMGVDQRWIAGREYRTGAGTFSVFAAGTRIEAEQIPPGQLDHVEYLRLWGPLAAALEQALDITPDRPLILPAASASLSFALTQATKAVFDRPPHWPWVLVGVLAELTRTLATTRHQAPLPAVRLVDRVRTLVEESPHRPWSMKELAILLGVRRQVLWAAFMEQTGQSPGTWIRRHRIRVAQTLLNRALTVRETAERLGFSSRQQLARSFRGVTGRAPSAHGP